MIIFGYINNNPEAWSKVRSRHRFIQKREMKQKQSVFCCRNCFETIFIRDFFQFMYDYRAKCGVCYVLLNYYGQTRYSPVSGLPYFKIFTSGMCVMIILLFTAPFHSFLQYGMCVGHIYRFVFCLHRAHSIALKSVHAIQATLTHAHTKKHDFFLRAGHSLCASHLWDDLLYTEYWYAIWTCVSAANLDIAYDELMLLVLVWV